MPNFNATKKLLKSWGVRCKLYEVGRKQVFEIDPTNNAIISKFKNKQTYLTFLTCSH